MGDFKNKVIEWLISYDLKPEYANNENYVCKLIVKYFEAANTISGVFEQGEVGYEAWEYDYDLARIEYYPAYIKKYNNLKK